MSITLPFGAHEFFALFGAYNRAIWPMPVVLTVLGAIALLAAMRGGRRADILVTLLLAALWGWAALAYHLMVFTRINPVAYLFALLSVIAMTVFVWQGLYRARLHFGWPGWGRGLPAAVLVVFALGGYPLWSALTGHGYPQMPTFGTPCPVTLFTLGMLGFLRRPYPRTVLVVPLAWCLVGAQAAWLLGVHPDLSLIAAGLFGLYLLISAAGSGRGRQG